MRFERSAIGAVFALLAKPFKAPLPLHHRVDLPVVVDVHPVGKDVIWSRQLGASEVVRSVKSTVIKRTDGGLSMVLDAKRFRFTLTMTHPLWGTTFRQTGLFTTLKIPPWSGRPHRR